MSCGFCASRCDVSAGSSVKARVESGAEAEVWGDVGDSGPSGLRACASPRGRSVSTLQASGARGPPQPHRPRAAATGRPSRAGRMKGGDLVLSRPAAGEGGSSLARGWKQRATGSPEERAWARWKGELSPWGLPEKDRAVRHERSPRRWGPLWWVMLLLPLCLLWRLGELQKTSHVVTVVEVAVPGSLLLPWEQGQR